MTVWWTDEECPDCASEPCLTCARRRLAVAEARVAAVEALCAELERSSGSGCAHEVAAEFRAALSSEVAS